MIERDDPRLTAYALGEADAETARIVEDALRGSDALRDEVDGIRGAADLLTRALAAEEAPALLPAQRNAIEKQVPAVPRRSRAARVAVWAGLAAAAVVALAAVGIPSLLRARVSLPPPRNADVALYVEPSQAVPTRPPARAIAPGAPHTVVPPAATSGDATVQGVVRDFTGAVLPGARVIVTNPATGAQREITTDARGRFQANGLPAGQVVLSADLPGFNVARTRTLNAPAGAVVTWSPKLEIGVLAETVTVAGETTPPITTTLSVPGILLKDEGVVVSTDEASRVIEEFNREAYAHREDNDFLEVAVSPLSTFGADVDTASYANVRRFLEAGQRPPAGAVRIEELVNYFPYDYEPPPGDEAFAAHVEVAPAPWKGDHQLVRIGLKAREIAAEDRPASNLVFLIDVSGSMDEPNKLPLVQRSLKMLARRLENRDRVALVVYAGSAGLVLPSTPGDQHAAILQAIGRLQAGGSTNGGQGIQLAYDIATRAFIRGGVNRVVLATDGDFNVGLTDEDGLVRLVQEKARKGVFLSVLGFGMGNFQDSRLETLADKGNGNYAYIDTPNEARKALVEQMMSTLVTVAKDVKIQVEFNPARVQAYRLIGYENRALRPEDFKDDRKDAGEVGAGHTVTALYELVPVGVPLTRPRTDPLTYQRPARAGGDAHGGELMRVKLRYKQPDSDTSQALEWPVTAQRTTLEETSPDYRFAAAVAQFGMLLRDSPHKGASDFASVLALAEAGRGEDRWGYRAEFVDLAKKARGLMGRE